MDASQRGASGIYVAVVLLLVAAAILVALAFKGSSGNVERGGQAAASFKVIREALAQYVTANGRLPCPANPTLDTGDANPVTATAACATPAGTVPWKAIGLRREDALDPWGGKISYRVFSGATGLTQSGGASMVNCDTVEPSPQPVDASGLCPVAHNTTEALFLAGKGLTINFFGTVVNDAAYVLISHGPTGLGAYTSAGMQKALPANTSELANTQAAPASFFGQAASATGVGPGDAGHFDDLVAYEQIGTLLRLAGVGGRDWPEVAGPASVKFDAPTVSGAMGSPVTTGGLGVSTLNFASAGTTVTGSGELSFDDTTGSGVWSGMGIAGGGSNLIQSSASEFLRLDFTAKATQFGLTLGDFGGYGMFFLELVQLNFYLDGTPVSNQFAFGCNLDGGLASFAFPIGADFNRVDIIPLAAPNFFPPPSDGITAFLVSEIKACDATATECRTSLDDASTNRCF